jgi:hypothetical protein
LIPSIFMISFFFSLHYTLFLSVYLSSWKLKIEMNVLWSLTLIWQISCEILGILNILIPWNSSMFCLKNQFLLMKNSVGFCEFYLCFNLYLVLFCFVLFCFVLGFIQFFFLMNCE